eukprot:TRINITY_DN1817_c0_g1_i1.p1 TRINITY_DN1817_c0_g1~~TRINITY_DN1817_c0_g1_i1.p1  ORF type:complete len:328 (+),score=47.65 TRINITY_DN1817_c0_g1_i1:34-1017(+)
MTRVVVLYIAIILTSSSVLCSDKSGLNEEAFTSFVRNNNKVYRNEKERLLRLSIFSQNLKRIEKLSAQYPNLRLGVTSLADLTYEEYLSLFKTDLTTSSSELEMRTLPTENLPDRVDWREKGVVTDAKNQGLCGSCWAFSTTASVESLTAINTGVLRQFSEQQLVDCCTTNFGCQGGLFENSYAYIRDNGMESEDRYPYRSVRQTCRYDPKFVLTRISSFAGVPAYDQDQLAAAVANQPTVSGLDFSHPFWQYYQGGIVDDQTCGLFMGHGILAVGYDTENGIPYFIFKNSFGPNWGENGFFRILRSSTKGVPGICGLGTYSTYPIF